MNVFDWLPTINESRLFRSSTAITRRNADDIKNLLVLYFSALTIMREEFETGLFVQNYLTKTFARGMNFNNVTKSDNDLYWLIYVIKNQKYDMLDPKFENENKTELERISVPITQLRTYVKNSVKGTATVAVTRSFMMQLVRELRITNNDYKTVAIASSNWLNLNSSQRNIVATRLLFALKKHAMISEIYPEFEKFVAEKKYLLADVVDPEVGKGDSSLKKLGKQALVGLAVGAAGAMILNRRRESAESYRKRIQSYFKR